MVVCGIYILHNILAILQYLVPCLLCTRAEKYQGQYQTTGYSVLPCIEFYGFINLH